MENLNTDPIENLRKKPAKGILKPPAEAENHPSYLQRQNSHDKDLRWDERNILQTLHPVDKDYGHMKIQEPKTPYSYFIEDDDGVHSDSEMCSEIDPDNLAKLIEIQASHSGTHSTAAGPAAMDQDDDDDDDDDLSERENETSEEKQKRKEFEQRRKKHYNEYQMVKLARQLLEEEDDDD